MSIARRYPLLKPEEEIHLGRRIQRWLSDPNPTPMVVRSGRRARERFVLCNLRLVARMVRSFSRNAARAGVQVEDLLQEGVIGLTRAAEKYSPTCGYKMSTYATWWIRQAMSRCIEMRGHPIRVSHRMRKRVYAYEAAAAAGGTTEQIATRLGLTVAEVENARVAQVGMRVVALDAMPRPDAIAQPEVYDDGYLRDLGPERILEALRTAARQRRTRYKAFGLTFTADGARCPEGHLLSDAVAISHIGHMVGDCVGGMEVI